MFVNEIIICDEYNIHLLQFSWCANYKFVFMNSEAMVTLLLGHPVYKMNKLGKAYV